jgi:hypothetical protein
VADYAPVYAAGVLPWTSTTSAAVTGGTLAAVSGASTVATAGAASLVVCGVFAHDAASGAKVTIWPLEGVVHEIVTANNITAGGGIQAAASGLADPVGTGIAAGSAAGTLIGTATTTATAPAKVRFQGRR